MKEKAVRTTVKSAGRRSPRAAAPSGAPVAAASGGARAMGGAGTMALPPRVGQPASGSPLKARRWISTALRNLDIVAVCLATAPALVLGAPVFGYLVGGGGWVLQRIVGHLDKRWVKAAGAGPKAQLGVNLFEAFGRIWLLAGAIVVAGVAGGRSDGLTAAVTIFIAYSIAFAIRVLTGPRRADGAARRSASRPAGPGDIQGRQAP